MAAVLGRLFRAGSVQSGIFQGVVVSWDIYGNPLQRGHCEVHPHVHEEYPCSVCIAEKEQHNQQDENAYLLAQCQDYINDMQPLVDDAKALLEALSDLLALAERWEESLDSHYSARSIEEIEADGDLADEIIQARALIAKHGGGV